MTVATVEIPDFVEPALPGAEEYAPAPEEVAPEAAPHGVTRDGKPRRKPGPKPKTTPAAPARASSTRTRRSRPASSSAPEGPAIPPTPKPIVTGTRPTREQYRDGILAYLQVPQLSLVSAALVRGDQALMADAAVVGTIGTPAAELLADLAAANPKARAVQYLDRALIVGPYAQIGTALLRGTMQILANHGKIHPDSVLAKSFGVVAPETLAQTMLAQLAEQQDKEAAGR